MQMQRMSEPSTPRSMSDIPPKEKTTRPTAFKSTTKEVLFVLSICLAQMMVEYFVSGFNLLLPAVSSDLNIQPNAQTWPASSFSLVVAGFLLTFGRISDMVGGKIVYLCGLAWLFVWSLVAALSVNSTMLNVARAFSGFGPAAFIPSTIALMGKMYVPGPRKNLVFSIYGFSAVAGFMIGITLGGVISQFTTWRWYFYAGAILCVFSFVAALLSIPGDYTETRKFGVKMDYWGMTTITSGLILATYALIDSSRVEDGWKTPYISTLFCVGLVLFATGFWGETMPRLTQNNPLLPPSIWKVPSFAGLLASLVFSFGSVGIYLLYAVLWFEYILRITPLLQVAYFVPLILGGFALSLFAGAFLHKIPATYLILISTIVLVLPPLLFIYSPLEGASGPRYWSYFLTSMICGTIGIDINFNVANIFISTSLPRSQQGLAGSLIQAVLEIGIALGLAFAEIISHQTMIRYPIAQQDTIISITAGYKNVFWLEFAFAVAGFVIAAAFVRIGKQTAMKERIDPVTVTPRLWRQTTGQSAV